MSSGEYARIDGQVSLREKAGNRISVMGRISDVPWQHIIAGFDDCPYSYYFDFGDDQTVIYCSEEIACTGEIIVYGTVVEVGTRSKKPGDDTRYTEFQIRVDRVDCL